MPRGYRRFVFATLGWLVLAGTNHPDLKGAHEQARTQHGVTHSAELITSGDDDFSKRTERADKQTEPCQPGDDRRYSDLCAQWKAADAAADSAWWAWASGVAGLFSLLGVLVAIGLAYHSNWIARDTAKRQLRAYLTVEPTGINQPVEGQARVALQVKNVGQTPASAVMVFSRFALSENPRDFDPKSAGFPIVGEVNDGSIGPSVTRYIYSRLPLSFFAENGEKIAERAMAVVHYGYVCYQDIFGVQRETWFTFYHWGDELSAVTSLRSRFGNSAT